MKKLIIKTTIYAASFFLFMIIGYKQVHAQQSYQTCYGPYYSYDSRLLGVYNDSFSRSITAPAESSLYIPPSERVTGYSPRIIGVRAKMDDSFENWNFKVWARTQSSNGSINNTNYSLSNQCAVDQGNGCNDNNCHDVCSPNSVNTHTFLINNYENNTDKMLSFYVNGYDDHVGNFFFREFNWVFVMCRTVTIPRIEITLQGTPDVCFIQGATQPYVPYDAIRYSVYHSGQEVRSYIYTFSSPSKATTVRLTYQYTGSFANPYSRTQTITINGATQNINPDTYPIFSYLTNYASPYGTGGERQIGINFSATNGLGRFLPNFTAPDWTLSVGVTGLYNFQDSRSITFPVTSVSNFQHTEDYPSTGQGSFRLNYSYQTDSANPVSRVRLTCYDWSNGDNYWQTGQARSDYVNPQTFTGSPVQCGSGSNEYIDVCICPGNVKTYYDFSNGGTNPNLAANNCAVSCGGYNTSENNPNFNPPRELPYNSNVANFSNAVDLTGGKPQTSVYRFQLQYFTRCGVIDSIRQTNAPPPPPPGDPYTPWAQAILGDAYVSGGENNMIIPYNTANPTNGTVKFPSGFDTTYGIPATNNDYRYFTSFINSITTGNFTAQNRDSKSGRTLNLYTDENKSRYYDVGSGWSLSTKFNSLLTSNGKTSTAFSGSTIDNTNGVFTTAGALTIGAGTTHTQCRGKKIIFVNGSLSVTPPFTNYDSNSGCIFVVNDSTSIANTAAAIAGNDQISAFIISKNSTTTSTRGVDSDPQLYVDGSILTNSITLNRNTSADFERSAELMKYDPRYLELFRDYLGADYSFKVREINYE